MKGLAQMLRGVPVMKAGAAVQAAAAAAVSVPEAMLAEVPAALARVLLKDADLRARVREALDRERRLEGERDGGSKPI